MVICNCIIDEHMQQLQCWILFHSRRILRKCMLVSGVFSNGPMHTILQLRHMQGSSWMWMVSRPMLCWHKYRIKLCIVTSGMSQQHGMGVWINVMSCRSKFMHNIVHNMQCVHSCIELWMVSDRKHMLHWEQYRGKHLVLGADQLSKQWWRMVVHGMQHYWYHTDGPMHHMQCWVLPVRQHLFDVQCRHMVKHHRRIKLHQLRCWDMVECGRIINKYMRIMQCRHMVRIWIRILQ